MQENKKRYLGIDYGSKRVGLALSDEGNKFALPLSVITNDDQLVSKIEKIALDNEVKEIILGESRDFSGKPNSILIDSLEFNEKIEAKGFVVIFEPEFLTCIQAERWQGKNELVDASAAAIILQSYLDREVTIH